MQWLARIVLVGVVVGLVAIHLDPSPPKVALSDKLVHAAAYYALAVALWVSLPIPSIRGRALVALGIGMLTGAILETLQVTVPGRTPDDADLLADLIGLVGALGPLALGAWMRGIEPRLEEFEDLDE